MALEDYNETAWVNDTAPAINAENLNNIEKGIFDATEAIQALELNPAGYILPPATITALGGVMIELVDNGDGTFTGKIWVS